MSRGEVDVTFESYLLRQLRVCDEQAGVDPIPPIESVVLTTELDPHPLFSNTSDSLLDSDIASSEVWSRRHQV